MSDGVRSTEIYADWDAGRWEMRESSKCGKNRNQDEICIELTMRSVLALSIAFVCVAVVREVWDDCSPLLSGECREHGYGWAAILRQSVNRQCLRLTMYFTA